MRKIVFILLFGCSGAMADASLDALINQAGNAPDDAMIRTAVEAIANNGDLDDELREQAAQLVKEIDRWQHNPKLDYFDQSVRKEGTYDFGIPESSPLYPLCELYLARMKVWVTLEYGGYWSNADARRARFDEIRPVFERLHDRFPDSTLIRMYLGEPQMLRSTKEAPEGAPAWAIHQRDALEGLADIITWWIDNRMQPDGQYGGGWGDDCEMWRWWVPVLIGFDDPKISAAQEKFSSALIMQPHLAEGYMNGMTDVEHSAEDTADILTPMMHLRPDDPVWAARSIRLGEFFENLWTGVNDRGQLQFKSIYFNSREVSDRVDKACDTVYHPRAVQPTLLYWQRTHDEQMGALFTRWMDTWVDAAAREERGKPAGIIPSAIRWPDGAVGGAGEEWWRPEPNVSNELYRFPSAMPQMTNTLLQTHFMTGNEKYLAPIRSMAQARLDFLNNPPDAEPEPGSRMWCAKQIGSISAVVAKYRFLTGNTEFDALLDRDCPPYVDYRLTGDTTKLEAALMQTAQALTTNMPGYTSEVRYTDRVLRFPHMYGENGMFREAKPGILVPDTDLLYSCITGDPGSIFYFPMNAVRWNTPPRDFAALVRSASDAAFEALVYHFGDTPRSMGIELPMLKAGAYTLELTGDSGQRMGAVAFEVKPSLDQAVVELPPDFYSPQIWTKTIVTVEVPSRQVCTVRVRAE